MRPRFTGSGYAASVCSLAFDKQSVAAKRERQAKRRRSGIFNTTQEPGSFMVYRIPVK